MFSGADYFSTIKNAKMNTWQTATTPREKAIALCGCGAILKRRGYLSDETFTLTQLLEVIHKVIYEEGPIPENWKKGEFLSFLLTMETFMHV